MTTTNKQRRAQRATRDQTRREQRALEAQRIQIQSLRISCIQQLREAGFSDPEGDFRRIENEAAQRNMHFTALVALVISERRNAIQRPQPIAMPDPHFEPGDTFTFSMSPPAATVGDIKQALPRRGPRMALRNHALMSIIALSMVGYGTVKSDE